MNYTKILLAIKYDLIRSGIQLRLNVEDEPFTVHSADNGEEMKRQNRDNDFDILILDLEMPDIKIPGSIEELKRHNGDLRILALSDASEAGLIKRVIEAGASGFVHKEESVRVLLNAIRSIKEGDLCLCNKTIKMLMMGSDGFVTSGAASGKLSERELEVLKLICNEYTNIQIADELGISESTVAAHRRNLLKKTGKQNTAGLVTYAFKNRLLQF